MEITLDIEWEHGLIPIGGECCQMSDAGHKNDSSSRLIGSVRIGGTLHHIEAWEVQRIDDLTQKAICPAENHFEMIAERMTEGPGATVEINGRDYFVVISPFQMRWLEELHR